jgi:hypothetical protein
MYKEWVNGCFKNKALRKGGFGAQSRDRSRRGRLGHFSFGKRIQSSMAGT